MSEQIRRGQLVKDASDVKVGLEKFLEGAELSNEQRLLLTTIHAQMRKVVIEMRKWQDAVTTRSSDDYNFDTDGRVLVLDPTGAIVRIGEPASGERWIPLPLETR